MLYSVWLFKGANVDLHQEYTCQHCKRQVKPWMSLTYFLETGEKVVIRYCTFPDCRKETEVVP